MGTVGDKMVSSPSQQILSQWMSLSEAARVLPRGMLRELNEMLHEVTIAVSSGITQEGLGGRSCQDEETEDEYFSNWSVDWGSFTGICCTAWTESCSTVFDIGKMCLDVSGSGAFNQNWLSYSGSIHPVNNWTNCLPQLPCSAINHWAAFLLRPVVSSAGL